MGPIGRPKTTVTINVRRVESHNSEDLKYIRITYVTDFILPERGNASQREVL